MRESNGNSADSVLPPAVGALRMACSPASSGVIACCWSGRRLRQPNVATMWCWSAGCSASKLSGRSREIEFDVVGARRDARRPLFGGHLCVGDGQRVVAPRMEVRELIDAVEHVPDELAQEQA